MSTRTTQAVAALAAVLLAVLLAGCVSQANPSTPGTHYYVSAAGSDTSSGTSPHTPWQSLQKVNDTEFSAGDSISFRKGDEWIGNVVLDESGTPASAIRLNSYGNGKLATITSGEGGNCFRLNGSYIEVDGLRATNCGYAGFNVYGDHVVVRNSEASDNTAGIKVGTGSDFGNYSNNVLTNNNVMNVNTPGSQCGTAEAANCTDDSGAFGVLINGNDNEFAGNTVTGSTAFSYDFSRDGSAFEIYNGSRNNIHNNKAIDNNVFSEIGRSNGAADGNVFRYNLIRSSCGAECAEAAGLIIRGPGTRFGPTNSTTFEFNTVWLNGSHSRGVVCHASCPSSTVIRANILVAVRDALWLDGSGWTEQSNVVNGPSNVPLDNSSTAAPAEFVNPPEDLHLTSGSPAIDRAANSPSGVDLDQVAVPQSGQCSGSGQADAGAYEYRPPNC
ncbi:choice-of-anchor Q domain-containing protein [Arthrobacter sp. NPDC056727]|uniref:choice-of-anchor Q domain-containing protein n=1 Tax=Arthrobacter sp. NPDC056727 TaxID=3345927 RepID=UPI00366E9F79